MLVRKYGSIIHSQNEQFLQAYIVWCNLKRSLLSALSTFSLDQMCDRYKLNHLYMK